MVGGIGIGDVVDLSEDFVHGRERHDNHSGSVEGDREIR